jgi:hypothetical protein
MAIYRRGQRLDEKLRKSSISGVCVQSAGVNPLLLKVFIDKDLGEGSR